MNAIKHKNRTELIGEVTRDAVLAYTPSGVAVLKFSIETRRDYEGKHTAHFTTSLHGQRPPKKTLSYGKATSL
jgi:Single-strand binding protein family.